MYYNKSLKQEIVKYYQNTCNLDKIKNKFHISSNWIKILFNEKESNSILKTNLTNFNYNVKVLSISIRQYMLLSIITYILNTKVILIFNKVVEVFKLLTYLIQNNITYRIRQKAKTCPIRLKLRKIIGYIKFKSFEVFIEAFIIKVFNISYNIKINNIILQKGLFFKYNPKIIKKYKKQEVFLFQTLILSILYNNTKILSDYISLIIKLDKNHLKTLRKFVIAIEQVFFSNIIKINGFQMRLNGKLSGKMRKSKYHYKIGKMQLQTLQTKLNFSYNVSFTKFGTISIKI